MLSRNTINAILFPMEKNFGAWLKQEREKQGLNQSELADLSGLNRAIISKLESDPTIEPKPDTLIAIARGLKIPRNTIFIAFGWLEENNSNLQVEEATQLLSMLEDDDLEEIIEIARMKLDRQKPKQQTSRSKRPARSALKEK